jgi:hypothetical protein
MAVETVQFCPICRTKTWFVDGVCEWSDGHAVMEQARLAPKVSVGPAGCKRGRGGCPIDAT